MSPGRSSRWPTCPGLSRALSVLAPKVPYPENPLPLPQSLASCDSCSHHSSPGISRGLGHYCALLTGKANRPSAYRIPGEAAMDKMMFSYLEGSGACLKEPEPLAKRCSLPFPLLLPPGSSGDWGRGGDGHWAFSVLQQRNLRRHSYTRAWVSLHSGQLFRKGGLPFWPPSKIWP